MMQYLVQTWDWIFVKGYRFLSLIMLNNLQQMYLNLLQKEKFKKQTEPTDDLIGNKIVNKITKISKTLKQNNSETVTNEHEETYLKRCISPEERPKIITLIVKLNLKLQC